MPAASPQTPSPEAVLGAVPTEASFHIRVI